MSSFQNNKEKSSYIFSSQLRADQIPGPPQEDQLMCTLFWARVNTLSNATYVILPGEGSHGITLSNSDTRKQVH